MNDSYKACIVLSTYNGAMYIHEQLKSLLAQDFQDLAIYVRDDGSTDSTVQILSEYEERGEIIFEHGANLGVCRSFLTALSNAPVAEVYFLCDQDDVWLSNKVSTAYNQMRNVSAEIKLYYGSYTLVDSELRRLNDRPFDQMPMCLEGILCYNCAVGATMAISRKLRDLACCDVEVPVLIHDWWILLVCLANNGFVVYDSRSHILYRQHSSNEIGCKRDVVSRIKKRLPWGKVQKSMYKARRKFAQYLLCYYGKDMECEALKVLHRFANYDKDIKHRYRLALGRRVIGVFSRFFIKSVLLRLDILTGRL